MRKIMFVLSVLILSISFISFTSEAKPRKIKIDHHVKSTDGCEWHLTGYIEVELKFGWPPLEITSWNVRMKGPCGDYHFQGLVIPNNTNPYNFTVDGVLYDLKINQQIEFETFPQFIQLINLLGENLKE